MFYFPVYALYHYYPEAFWVHVALTALLFAVGVTLIVSFYKKGKINKHCMGWGITLWVYTVFLLFITVIGRYSFDDFRARLIPFESYREYLATGSLSELRGIIGNVLMFIPFSFLCAQFISNLYDKNSKRIKTIFLTFGVSLLLTVTIELLQYLTRTGTFELDDLMHNVIGALLGILIWIIAVRVKGRTKSGNMNN